MSKWLLIASATVVCASVWIAVIFSYFLVPEKTQHPERVSISDQLDGEELTKSWDAVGYEEDEKKNDFSVRGLQRKDFDYIGPQREISIDELLAIINEGSQ